MAQTSRRSTRGGPRGGRIRLDALLVHRGLFPTRARAQAAIVAGEVYVNGVRVDKAGPAVADDVSVEIRPARPAFASRGGYKLDHALEVFRIAVDGVVAADVGASTGGFTDVLLQRGARTVLAIDVGTGQLDWRLRHDPRVVNLERRDVRSVRAEELGGQVDLVTVDVSFISLERVLPSVQALLRPGGTAVVLVKPQFELGPRQAKRGVVREAPLHRQALERVITFAASTGWSVLAATASPIRGPEGNIEFLLHLRHGPGEARPIDVEGVVRLAHETIGSSARRPAERR